MKNQRISAILMMMLLINTSIFPVLSLTAQAQEMTNQNSQDRSASVAEKATQIVERYRENKDLQTGAAMTGDSQLLAQKQEHPQWVQEAVKHSLEELQLNKERYGVEDAGGEFQLLEAIKDGRGSMDIRLAQVHNSVPVFAGQLIAHLDNRKVIRAVSGRMFTEARINTVPKLDERQAIEAAKTAFKDAGTLAQEPTAKLAIVPRKLINRRESGAVLVYIVKVKIANKGGAIDGYRLFINARNGAMVWRLSDQHTETGTGISLYNGTVDIETTHNDNDGSFTMKDPLRNGSQVFDANDGNIAGTEFRGFDNAWGDQSRETAAVDAHFGVAQSWEYFKNRQAREGADDDGTPMTTYVHYRPDPDSPWNNASGGGNELRFGDGDGSDYGPYVPIDIVGHEFTHCVVDDTVNLVGSGESGAVNEAFADIFGTAIGFYAGTDTNYQHGEAKIIPGSNGFLQRDLIDPSLVWIVFDQGGPNQETVQVPDNWSMYWPDLNNFDDGGEHINSTIMSHAFYLMSEGGINRTSQVSVTPISYNGRTPREVAEDIFYTALAQWLTPSATFLDVAKATRAIAANYYNREVAAAVERAWFAVGVFTNADLFYSALPQPALSLDEIVLYDPATGFGETGHLHDVGGSYVNQQTYGTFATGWTHVVSMNGQIFYYNAATCQAAVGEISLDGQHRTTNTFRFKFLGARPVYSHVVYMGGFDLYFYEASTGRDLYIRLTPSGYQGINFTYTPGKDWTHVVNVQGSTLFYRRDTGGAIVITGTTKRTITLSPFWSHIVDCGIRTGSGAQIGILFYNAVTGLYEVRDLNQSGTLTRRSSNNWSYTALRPGWTHVVKAQDAIFFYDSQTAEAMTGYLLTAQEGVLHNREPFLAMPESYGYVPSLRPYQKVAGGLAR
jgi:Zn-dependent metalloprotease